MLLGSTHLEKLVERAERSEEVAMRDHDSRPPSDSGAPIVPLAYMMHDARDVVVRGAPGIEVLGGGALANAVYGSIIDACADAQSVG